MSEQPALVFENGTVRTRIDLRVYRLSAAKKAAYRVAGSCTAIFGTPDNETLPVSFAFKPGTKEEMALEAVRGFFQELLDQELREQVAEETQPMRVLILAQAFSKTDLIHRE